MRKVSDIDQFESVTIDWLDDQEWVATPLQERSKKTLEQILQAAKTLFIEKGFDETTMAEISKRAGISVGSIYHRFTDKLSILYMLLEMYRRARFDQIGALVSPDQWLDRSAEEVVALNIEIMFSTAIKDTGFIRLMERQRIVNPTVCELLVDWNEHIVTVITALMAPHAKRVVHDDLEQAVRYTHGMIRGAVMWAILPVQPNNPPFNVLNAEFRRRAYDMAVAYLGLERIKED